MALCRSSMNPCRRFRRQADGLDAWEKITSPNIAKRLNSPVRQGNGRVTTGFLSSPKAARPNRSIWGKYAPSIACKRQMFRCSTANMAPRRSGSWNIVPVADDDHRLVWSSRVQRVDHGGDVAACSNRGAEEDDVSV